MNDKQIQALKNYPYPLVTSTMVAASALRAAANLAKQQITDRTVAAVNALWSDAHREQRAITSRTEIAVSDMRREYAQQILEANRILDGTQEPYGIDHSMNQIL